MGARGRTAVLVRREIQVALEVKAETEVRGAMARQVPPRLSLSLPLSLSTSTSLVLYVVTGGNADPINISISGSEQSLGFTGSLQGTFDCLTGVVVVSAKGGNGGDGGRGGDGGEGGRGGDGTPGGAGNPRGKDGGQGKKGLV